MCWFRGIRHSLSPYRLFPVLSFTYVGAMVASNSALAFITYPTQVGGLLHGVVCAGPPRLVASCMALGWCVLGLFGELLVGKCAFYAFISGC